MKKNKHKLIPLLESGINPGVTPTQVEKDNLKNFYLILECRENHSLFVKNEVGIFIMYNEKLKQIGNTNFRIKSEITIDSSSEEIQKEIKRYFGFQHKVRSMHIHPYLQPIKLSVTPP